MKHVNQVGYRAVVDVHSAVHANTPAAYGAARGRELCGQEDPRAEAAHPRYICE